MSRDEAPQQQRWMSECRPYCAFKHIVTVEFIRRGDEDSGSELKNDVVEENNSKILARRMRGLRDEVSVG